jgi:hypothetical protein
MNEQPGAPSPTGSGVVPELLDPSHDKAARRRRRWRLVGACLSLALLGLSAVVLFNTLRSVSWHDLRAAFEATGWDQILLASAFASLSYLALTGYDGLALRQLALRVPYRTTALGSFTSYAISFTLGFPIITGGTVRYWIYSQKGVSAAKVASLTVIAGVTFWLGMTIVVGAALVFDPVGIAEVNHLKVGVNVTIGLGVLAAILVYLVWVSLGHRRTRIQGLTLELPGFWLTLSQMLLGVFELCAAAGCLYALLPRGHGADPVTFAATYVFACLLGIASNAPGGIGAFEVTMLKSVPAPSQEGLLASLLLFRMVYYIGPFILALALLGAHESMRRWTSLREAMARRSEEDGRRERPDSD